MARWNRRSKTIEIAYAEPLPQTIVHVKVADDAKSFNEVDDSSLGKDECRTKGIRWRQKQSTNSTTSSSVVTDVSDVPSALIGRARPKSPRYGIKGASDWEIAKGSVGSVMPILHGSHWPDYINGELVDSLAKLSPIDVNRLIADLEESLGFDATSRARKDNHARRKPIPCGVPLLTGHACNYACQYCYLQDWYPFARPTPTPLTGKEVLLSLLYNPFWVPSRDFIILGDACDPFHPDLENRTLEYLEAVAPLKSPIQFSTKSAISQKACERLAHIRRVYECSVNVLVTITTIEHAHVVEPLAPSVEQRLETIRRLSSLGISVFVFMRPLLPGASEDFANVLTQGKHAGADGVIVGSLRVSEKIRRRLRRIPIVDIEAIDTQLRTRQIDPEGLTENQIDIQDEPLRAAIKTKAEEVGLVSVRRACCANAWVSKMPCRKPKCLMKDVSNW